MNITVIRIDYAERKRRTTGSRDDASRPLGTFFGSFLYSLLISFRTAATSSLVCTTSATTADYDDHDNVFRAPWFFHISTPTTISMRQHVTTVISNEITTSRCFSSFK